MRVLILHDALPEGARPDELDVLDQADAVAAALDELGHHVERAPFDGAVDVLLSSREPDVVFNLVESIDRQGRLSYRAAELLEQRGVPFTGAGAFGLRASAGKLDTKRLLLDRDLPAPVGWSAEALAEDPPIEAGCYIVKSVWEHGSLGLETDSVVEASAATDLRRALATLAPRVGGEALAERYVHGREFNVGLLTGPDGACVLPIAEIRFAGGDAREPRVVGYRAKWFAGSAEDRATPRAFGTAGERLSATLGELALRTWAAFDLRGYARVDFRVDDAGRPWIIDVNANPCLTPGSGFPAAFTPAGLTYPDAIRRIVAAALQRSEGSHVPHPADRR